MIRTKRVREGEPFPINHPVNVEKPTNESGQQECAQGIHIQSDTQIDLNIILKSIPG